jgi:translation initiation factor 6 (eIF-6)
MQDTFLLAKRGEGGSQGLASNKNIAEHLQNLHCHVHRMQTDRNCISNYILFNSQGGMTVYLLELQLLKVLLTIPKVTDEAIWIMSRMVINRRNLI